MKKDWLKDIHDRMADFESEEPQGLWEGICAAEPNLAETTTLGNSKANTHRIWMGSAAAVAACLLIIWLIRPALQQEGNPPMIASDSLSATENNQSNAYLSEPVVEHLLTKTEAMPYIDREAREKDAATTQTPSKTFEQETENPDAISDAATTTPSTSSDKEYPRTNHHRYEHLAQASHYKHNINPRLSLSFSTSGGMGSDNRQLFRDNYQTVSSMLIESDWVDSPLLGIMALNRGAETEKKVSHHSPIRTGLSLSYKLNDKWSVESGISYAFISSDIREGSSSSFIEEQQNLHYVGIPLGATYRLFSWRHLDLYLSSNLMAEQCISGQSHKRFIIGNKSQGEETNTISSKPTQWSVGAKAGVQYHLNDLLSLYAEPGYSYYFDNHSSLETVFKDKPFDFSLNLGLRFSIGE